ncbi:hypothetical protein LTR70_009179 [Exophiala xenobiotica]|uniref:Uncharacterized protein n=1 Tax=Lithohypha guttulata TaxID=1690604 RepID=A0ABR0JZ60_9EURO|nr:hypothetical protein LTR24_008958 [Lithohypha guttulata]KAK5310852.1 hypothetical protein LTR70_009179 [Exophiala xenobiotica]
MFHVTNSVFGLTVSYVVSLRPGLQNCKAFFDVTERPNTHLVTPDQTRQQSTNSSKRLLMMTRNDGDLNHCRDEKQDRLSGPAPYFEWRPTDSIVQNHIVDRSPRRSRVSLFELDDIKVPGGEDSTCATENDSTDAN